MISIPCTADPDSYSLVAPGNSGQGKITFNGIDSDAHVEISFAQTGDASLQINPGSSDNEEVTLHIISNRDWILVPNDNDPVTAGHLADWDGLKYDPSRKLFYPLKVKAASDATLPNAENKAIQTGSSNDGTGGQDVVVTLEQEAVPSDQHLPGGHTYRMIVVFTVSIPP